VARTLTITAAEWASGTADGALWIVREQDSINITDMTGAELNDGGFAATTFYRPGPPAEFVAACAPCETCHDRRYFVDPSTAGRGGIGGMALTDRDCPDCSIELVGPCPQVKGCPAGMAPLSCGQCHQIVQVGGTVTLGYGYAVGQPALIEMVLEVRQVAIAETVDGVEVVIPLDHLAHYGPPETLVGFKWALQLEVAS